METVLKPTDQEKISQAEQQALMEERNDILGKVRTTLMVAAFATALLYIGHPLLALYVALLVVLPVINHNELHPYNLRAGVTLACAVVMGVVPAYFYPGLGIGVPMLLLSAVLAMILFDARAFWPGLVIATGTWVATALLRDGQAVMPEHWGAFHRAAAITIEMVAGVVNLSWTQFQRSEVANYMVMLSNQKRELQETRHELTSITKRLDYERYLLQTILDNVSDKIYFKDLNNAYTRVSKAMAELVGLPREVMLGMKESEIYADSFIQQVRADEQEILKSNKPKLDKVEQEKWRDGRPETWAVTSRIPIFRQDGKLEGWLGTSRDITEMKLSEETNRKLERAMLENQMAGGFAHEMRNALSGADLVLAQAGDPESGPHNIARHAGELYRLLSEECRDEEWWETAVEHFRAIKLDQTTMEEAVQMAVRNVHSAMGLTSRILAYSELNQAEAGRDAVDLSEVIQEVIGQHKAALDNLGVEVVFKFDTNTILYGTRGHFETIVDNLVTNVCEAFAETEGERERVLTIGLADVDQKQVLTISDTAHGIPVENQKRIYEPFFSTKPTSGQGLGLCFVSKLTNIYHGTIEVTSAVDQGTTMALSFPLPEALPTDPVTGLCTRRHFLGLAEREFARAQRYSKPLSLIMLTVDNGGAIRGQYGPATYETVLKAMAEGCRDSLRKEDVIAYFGRETFVMLLPETALEPARDIVFPRLQTRIGQISIQSGMTQVAVNTSMGVVSLEGQPDLTLDALLKNAEAATQPVVTA